MGKFIDLTTNDGARISAYRADPAGTPKAGLVVVQEIFGVNHHIRSVADRYAAQGYLAVAPALFDRVERGVELGYDQAGREHAFAILPRLAPEQSLADIAAAIAVAQEGGKVGLVGYCWGGTLAWLSAARVSGLAACVGYYGGHIAKAVGETPKIPIMLHFGERDAHIPMSDVEAIRKAHPEVPVYDYPADHGFNCDERASYDKPSADLALERTLAFFAEHLA
ncbi:MAG TPA: dienelactone hydrolase family protein [Stellaceae bacterium]|nr:dienelactone hydrolase family protein [Stellaceae bacterium]